MLRYPRLVSLGITAFPKTHFWFGVHQKDELLKHNDEYVLTTKPAPIGPDTHILRSSFDSYLAKLFPKYGVSYIDASPVSEVEKIGETWRIETRKGLCFARLLVDASGTGLLSKRFGLINDPSEKMSTNSRNIYGLFDIKGNLSLDFLVSCESFMFRRHARTLHHCFPGGWMWIIPFDNGKASIGLTLNRDEYPEKTQRANFGHWCLSFLLLRFT